MKAPVGPRHHAVRPVVPLVSVAGVVMAAGADDTPAVLDAIHHHARGARRVTFRAGLREYTDDATDSPSAANYIPWPQIHTV